MANRLLLSGNQKTISANRLRDILLVLNTQGWEKLIKEKYHLEELLRLISRFKIPLEGAGADTEEIYKEFEEIMEYAVNFISLSTLAIAEAVHCPSRSEWANALILMELLFSLSVSNGKVERVFSTSKVEKGPYYQMSLLMTV